jgi:hypothetical protein
MSGPLFLPFSVINRLTFQERGVKGNVLTTLFYWWAMRDLNARPSARQGLAGRY